MGYQIENGLITGPQSGQCAGYIFNFTGHGSYDPTGKITIGDLEVTQEQVDAHNTILGKAEIDHAIQSGKGTFYLSYDSPPCTPENPRWKQENAGTWHYRNYRVSTWAGTFKTSYVHVKHGYSYGFGRFETFWVWFTGPDGKHWYGVLKGHMQCFNARRLKGQ